ncbi:MAG: MauE/DoxX family redox-associated membrane protein [Gaiellaceae bacterium]
MLSLLDDGGRLALGLVFALAGWSKARAPRIFVTRVRAYGLLAGPVVPVFSFGIVVAELSISLALLLGAFVVPALLAGVGLFGLFGAGVAVNLARERRVPCACFGKDEELISIKTLARLASLALAGIALVVLLTSGAATSHSPVDLWDTAVERTYLTAAASVAVGVALISRWLSATSELGLLVRSVVSTRPRPVR